MSELQLLPISQEAQLLSALGTSLTLTPVMQAEWDCWTHLERDDQLCKMMGLTGYLLEHEYNMWRNRADLEKLDQDFNERNLFTMEQ